MRNILRSSFFRKYISFSAGLWINALISFVTVPVVSWLINPSEFGKAAMFSTVYSLAVLISVFGMPNALMRFYHSQEGNNVSKLVSSTLVVPMVIFSVFSILVLTFSQKLNFFLIGDQKSNVHLILLLAVFFGILQTFNQTLIRIQERGWLFSTVSIVSSLSNVIVIILYSLLISRSVYAVLYGQLFSNIAALVVGMYFQRGTHDFRIFGNVDWSLLKEVVLYSYPFVLTGLLWWILGSTDRAFLRLFRDFKEIGLYSAAFKVVSVMGLFTTGFSNLWVPLAFKKYEEGSDYKDLFRKVFSYISFFSFSLGLLVVLGKDLIFLLFAKQYRASAYIAPFLLLTSTPVVLATVVARGIDFEKKTYWYIISDGVAALFNVVGNLLLIPILGAKGAAVTTGLSYVIVFLIEFSIAEKVHYVGYDIRTTLISMGVYIFVATVATFVESTLISSLGALFGIFVIFFLYRRLLYSGFEFLKKLINDKDVE